MATVDITVDTFGKTVAENDTVLVDFWAAWCGPCRQFAPVFEEASAKHGDVMFAKVDTEAEQQLASMAGITSIPTLMAFRGGVLVFSQAGALPGNALEDLLTQVKGLDIAEVRRMAEEQTAQSAQEGAQPVGQPEEPSVDEAVESAAEQLNALHGR